MKRTKIHNAHTNFKLPISLLDKLETLAKESKKTKGAVMRELLTNYLT
jgi:predicted DNA-binding protein